MSTVTVPDDLLSKLRAAEHDERADLSELVARVLRKYLSRSDAEELVRHAEERGAALTRAGVTEEDIVEHFHQWRSQEMADRVKQIREALAKAGISLSEEEVVRRVHEWRSQSHSGR